MFGLRKFRGACLLLLAPAIAVARAQSWPVITERPVTNFAAEAVYVGSVHYAPRSEKMGPRGLRELAMIAADIKDEKNYKIRIVGYSQQKTALAAARAEDVARALKNFGISMEGAVITTVVTGKKNSNKVDILVEKQPLQRQPNPGIFIWVLFVGFALLGLLAIFLFSLRQARPSWL